MCGRAGRGDRGRGLLVLAAPAAAADPPTLTGSARGTAHGPGVVGFTYTLDVAVGLDSAELTTHQDALLSADAGSVTFDGTAVARSQIAVSGGDLTIPLGAVAAGAHTVRFTARVPAAPSTVTKSSADLSYTQSGATQNPLHSAVVVVDINEPDIEVLSDFTEPGARAVGRHRDSGRVGFYGAQRRVRRAADDAAVHRARRSGHANVRRPTMLHLHR